MGGEAGATYDRIGTGYDDTRRPDPRIAAALARHLHPEPGRPYLDVACGTGNYAVELARRGMALVGVDRSSLMIAAARRKSSLVRWCQADVAALPFVPGAFAGAVSTLALHHFADLEGALHQVWRVLAVGARLVLFTGLAEQMRSYWLNEYFPIALARSIAQMPTEATLRRALGHGGFEQVTVEPWDVPDDLVDLFLYSGKHRPELYLNERVRQGISTFALLAEPDEVAAGLARLERDLRTGRINEVRARYASHDGDYAFVIAERRR